MQIGFTNIELVIHRNRLWGNDGVKFVFLFGPQAVGKMTVGQELSKRTGLKLFHNHMTIELLEPLFGFSSEMWRLSDLFREEIFKSFSRSDNRGLIFTYIWDFDSKEDWDKVNQICHIFRSQGADIYFVELEADLQERLRRNKTPHRLQHKPTKRNIKQSEHHLLSSMNNSRMNSIEGEIDRENYLKINNTNLSAPEVARIIIDTFKF